MPKGFPGRVKLVANNMSDFKALDTMRKRKRSWICSEVCEVGNVERVMRAGVRSTWESRIAVCTIVERLARVV